MAIEVWQDKISTLIAAQLAPRLRYRCLVLQTGEMPVLSAVCQSAIDSAASLGESPKVIDYSDLFDDIGALSCNAVIERLEAAAATSPVVLAGPLHYLDYWSEQMRGAFWKFLAGFTHGPGIIVVDTPRAEAVEGPFRMVGRIPGTEVRYLKSRLASTQDGLV
jgi:hypothetical protein